jgi:hypothetical protein
LKHLLKKECWNVWAAFIWLGKEPGGSPFRKHPRIFSRFQMDKFPAYSAALLIGK